jgi:hypothetical protein
MIFLFQLIKLHLFILISGMGAHLLGTTSRKLPGRRLVGLRARLDVVARRKITVCIETRISIARHVSDYFAEFNTDSWPRFVARSAYVSQASIFSGIIQLPETKVSFGSKGMIILEAHVSRAPITVATQSKAWIVFARSNNGIVDLNPTWGMDVCFRLFCVYVVLCVSSGLVTGLIPPPRSPTVYVKD